MDEGPGLGEFARSEELAHVLGKGSDGVGIIQQRPSFRQHGSGFLCGCLQLLPPVAVFQDAFRGIGHVQVGTFDEVPDAVKLPLDLLQFGLDGLQVLTLFSGHAVHLLVDQPHQVADVGLGEDVVPDVGDDDVLEGLGVEPGRVAGVFALLEQELADVVGVLATLGLGRGEGRAAVFALGQAAEQVGAGGTAGMYLFGSAGAQQPMDPAELLGGYDGGEGVFDADRFGLVLGPGTPD